MAALLAPLEQLVLAMEERTVAPPVILQLRMRQPRVSRFVSVRWPVVELAREQKTHSVLAEHIVGSVGMVREQSSAPDLAEYIVESADIA
jgi:hypothetical protein